MSDIKEYQLLKSYIEDAFRETHNPAKEAKPENHLSRLSAVLAIRLQDAGWTRQADSRAHTIEQVLNIIEGEIYAAIEDDYPNSKQYNRLYADLTAKIKEML